MNLLSKIEIKANIFPLFFVCEFITKTFCKFFNYLFYKILDFYQIKFKQYKNLKMEKYLSDLLVSKLNEKMKIVKDSCFVGSCLATNVVELIGKEAHVVAMSTW